MSSTSRTSASSSCRPSSRRARSRSPSPPAANRRRSARTLKEDLQRTIGPEYAEVNDLLGTLRKSAKSVLPTDVDRKRFFDGIIAAGVLDMLRDGRRREAFEAVARACEAEGVAISGELREALEAS